LTKLAPKPLEGPFRSLADFCATQRQGNRRGDPLICDEQRPPITSGLSHLGATSAFRQVELFTVASGTQCGLGLRTSAGWFVDGETVGCEWPGKRAIEIKELRVEGGVLVLRWVRRSRFSVNKQTLDEESEQMLLCGIGPSGKPSCTPAIPLRVDETRGGKSIEAKVDLTLGPNSTLELSGDSETFRRLVGGGWMAERLAPELGRRRIGFP
jgi:hypothetical protein